MIPYRFDKSFAAGGLACALTSLALLSASAPAHAVVLAAPAIVNGSMNGLPSNGSPPAGWTSLVATPDTVNVNNNAGSPYYAFPVTASASPDGGTWVGMATDNLNGFSERFGQTVTGFTVGSSYTVSWFASNFGFGGGAFGYTAPARIEVLVNGNSIGFGHTLTLQPGWVAESLTFTASASTLQLAFNAALGPRAYVGIDGIGVAPAAAVPEPGSLALMLTGALALAGVRKLRGRDDAR